MEQSDLFILLMLAIALASTLLLKVMCRRKQIDIQMIKTVCFFFLVNYFLVSGAKLYFGEDRSTLIESLWDIHDYTFLHYAAPLCAAGLILPVLMVFILRERTGKYIGAFDMSMILGGVLASILYGGILSNLFFCLLFAACAPGAFIAVCFYKKEIVYFHRGDYAEGCRMLFWPAVLAVIMLLIYFPSELYLANPEEFPCSFWGYLFTLVLGALVSLAAGMIVSLSFFSKKTVRLVSMLLFGLLAAGYLQALFLNGTLEILNGEELQQWSLPRQLFDILIWAVLVGTIVHFGLRKKGAEKVYKTVCIYICLIQIVSLGYMVLTTDLSAADKDSALTTSGSLVLSGEDNVLVFILDRFDSETFETIMAEDNGYLDPLADFTYYDDMTSQFSMTRSAIPYLLTGVPWNGKAPEDYVPYAYQEGRMLPSMSEKGYDLGIYVASENYSPLLSDITANYGEHVTRRCRLGGTVATMYKTSMYKMMPFTWKNNYSYYSSDIYGIVSSEDIWNIQNDVPFYQSLIHEGLSVDAGMDRAFRFYHMRGAHAPYYLSENIEYDATERMVTEMSQAKGSLGIVYEYLEQMKALGVYDSATIVITADHGQRVDIGAKIPSRPILLVKDPGVSQEAMSVVHAPVSQENLIPTLLKAMDIDIQGYEEPLDEVPLDEERERTYVDFGPGGGTQYSINGDVKDIESWGIKSQETY